MVHALVHSCFFLEILFNLELFFLQELLQTSINTKTNIFRRWAFKHTKLLSILLHFIFRLLVLLLFGFLFVNPFGKSKLEINAIIVFSILLLLLWLNLFPTVNPWLLHTRLNWGVSTLHHTYLLQILLEVAILFFEFFRFFLLLL